MQVKSELAPARVGPFPKSGPRPIDPLNFTLQPGGRWERILTHLATGAYREGDILRATDPGFHSRKVERKRIGRAIHAMADVGLVERVEGFGWTATARARAELDHIAHAKGDAAHV